jgi:hypothetical protein
MIRRGNPASGPHSREGTPSYGAVIIEEANRRCDALLDQMPSALATKTYIGHVVRLNEACGVLLSARPPVEPTAHAVAEQAEISGGRFLATQTLYNRFRAFLEIWREAFSALQTPGYLRSGVPQKLGVAGVSEDDLRKLDQGTIANLRYREADLRGLKLENQRLRAFIKEAVPLTAGLADQDLHALRAWLADLRSAESGLQQRSDGLRTTTRLRANTLLVPSVVLNILTQLTSEPSPPGPA